MSPEPPRTPPLASADPTIDNHAGRIISLGSALAKLAAAVVVPALCASRGGWRSAALALAGSFGTPHDLAAI